MRRTIHRLLLAVAITMQLSFAQRQDNSNSEASVPPNFTYPRSNQKVVLAEVRVKRLAGKVTATRGDLINGHVLVEVIDSETDEKRIDARFTDENGRFDFGSSRRRRKLWLKISMPGFDTVFVPVRIEKSTSSELVIQMSFSI